MKTRKKPAKKQLKEGSKDGRPRLGKEVRKVYSVRLEPSKHDAIVEKYGSLSKFLLQCINDLIDR